MFTTLRNDLNGHNFTDIFKCIFLKYFNVEKHSMNYAPGDIIENIVYINIGSGYGVVPSDNTYRPWP